MNLKEIKDIINLMNENDLSEIEIEREGTKIKLKKTSAEISEVTSSRPPVYYPEPKLTTEVVNGNTQTVNTKFKEIKSPMVGTFYRAPSPEAPPFVEIGQMVEVGQVVCIVEAMKLMNEIKSEVKGKVAEILVDNAQPVEFGQVIFRVEPV